MGIQAKFFMIGHETKFNFEDNNHEFLIASCNIYLFIHSLNIKEVSQHISLCPWCPDVFLFYPGF